MNTVVFKVALRWNRNIGRTVELLESQSLHHLHKVIQRAFEWDDDHLYAFFMTNKAWDNGGAFGGPHSDMPPASRVQLGQLALRPKRKFLYIFDVGDELRHEITVVRQGTTEEGVKYPRILESQGEAPPQCGEVEE